MGTFSHAPITHASSYNARSSVAACIRLNVRVATRTGASHKCMEAVACAVPQVDFLKLLYDKCMELHSIWAKTPHEAHFPRPLFKVRQAARWPADGPQTGTEPQRWQEGWKRGIVPESTY